MTPLYKSLKSNGTSFYAFPGAAEDISASYNNENYKMYFSKYILLNFPKQNTSNGSGTHSIPVQFDFSNFWRLPNTGQQATTFKDELIESLRNYVANHEETIRESKLNNTDYFYDNTSLPTTSEKIFWKWCKKLKLIDFDLSIDGDQYFGNLTEFQSNNINDTSYFPEVLWTERMINSYSVKNLYQSGTTYGTSLEIELNVATSTLKVDDIISFSTFTGASASTFNGFQLKVLMVIPADSSYNQRVVLDYTYTASLLTESTGSVTLVYSQLVQYIGEVNGINNVQAQNRSYTEVYAMIPDHTGMTPDILFRTMLDVNYKPGMTYPILPSQYQPEIVGAELFNSPIVNTPQNYPGNYYGQFDTQYEYTYTTADGDSLRRTGNYYGINGDINAPVIDGSNLDGLAVDFNPSHYVKMNVINRELTSFDQFNALEVNNQPPSDFEFNAILWYYTVEDSNGNSATNLYGISFVDNPDNNPVPSEVGLRIPPYKKLVATDTQDGTSYQFSLNLNYNIIADNPQDAYNPDAINSLFSFNLFNEAMRRLSSVSDSFNTIIGAQSDLTNQLNNVKQLIYTQTDFTNINKKIANLEKLLNLYSTNQIISSESIDVISNGSSTSIPTITLNSVDPQYGTIYNVDTTDLYNISGNIPMSLAVPKNKNLLVVINNNDETIQTLPNNQTLVVYFETDLNYKQSVDIIINSTDAATQNKKLEFFINYTGQVLPSLTILPPVQTMAFGPIDLPIYYNSNYQIANSAKNWNNFNFNISLNSDITLVQGNLKLPLVEPSFIVSNSIKKGDTLTLSDFQIGTSSTVDFSGQYQITEIDTVNNTITLDLSNNPTVSSYQTSNPTVTILTTLLSNMPYLGLNKGMKYRITCVSDTITSTFAERYLIQKL